MQKLKIHSVEGKGDLEKECVWLDVLEDVANLSHYMVCDTTYTDNDVVSNELRHMYWFQKRQVKKGDWIKLSTKKGVDTTASNKRKTTTHVLHWNLGKTVWNKDGDMAVLFELANWSSEKA